MKEGLNKDATCHTLFTSIYTVCYGILEWPLGIKTFMHAKEGDEKRDTEDAKCDLAALAYFLMEF